MAVGVDTTTLLLLILTVTGRLVEAQTDPVRPPVITRVWAEDGSGAEPGAGGPLREVVVDTGDEVRLQCVGDKKVEWSLEFTATDGSEWRSRYAADSSYQVGDGQHVTELTISDAVYSDTGRVVCRYAGGGGGAAEVYIYVRDPVNLFRKNAVTHVNLRPNKPAPLGCRPTNPEVQVTVKKGTGRDNGDGDRLPLTVFLCFPTSNQ